MKTKVLIILDAFRHDYITLENTPFLYDFTKNSSHFMKVQASGGFCERSEILSGNKPLESGYFTAIGYDPKNSPFRHFKFILALFDKLLPSSPDNYANKFVRKVIGKLSKFAGLGLSSYRIPLSDLANYRLTEDQFNLNDPRSLGDKSIIEILKKNGNIFSESFTSLLDRRSSSDKERLDKALKKSSDISNSLCLIYISEADSVGHKYGPNSTELKESIKSIDMNLKIFIEKFRENNPESEFILIGDHGMANVKNKIDIGSEIELLAKKLKLKYARDYTYFLDSTLCRIWFHNEKMANDFKVSILENDLMLDNGAFIDSKSFTDNNIPDLDRLYGDLVWSANVGNLIWPDFFHNDIKNPPLGMHGYLDYSDELIGFFAIDRVDKTKNTKSLIHLSDTYNKIIKE